MDVKNNVFNLFNYFPYRAHFRWLLTGLKKDKLDYFVDETKMNVRINMALAFIFFALLYTIVLVIIKIFRLI